MRRQYRGRTAKFTRNGHTYYATFEKNDVYKNIYGDNRSDNQGRFAKVRAGASGDIFELVENAVWYSSAPEKGKTNVSHKNIRYWDYFIKTVQIDDQVYDLLANVRRGANGDYVYNIALTENKKTKASPPLNRADTGSESEPIKGPSSAVLNVSDNSIPNSVEDVNGNDADSIKSQRRGGKNG